MLISPPFLPARGANETEDTWIDRCMAGGLAGDGSYPVSSNLGWHGGMHLMAPGTGTTFEAVRAVADGVVVFRRDPVPQPAGPLPAGHPQAYHGGWTDNGVVVIRHETEIGEGANATLTFFSIYMHLSSIAATVSTTANAGRIWRKAEIGQAGQVYGRPQRQIHFELVCDDANLQRLVGRLAGDLPLTADGRTDALYGEMYVQLPAGTQVFGQLPVGHSAVASMQPPRQGRTWPPLVPLQAVHTTAAEIIVGLRFAGGEGAAGQRGHLHVTSYRADGSTFGAALTEADADYNLYERAAGASERYPAGGRPAPSAVYELLRFGRVIGPDALNPADVPHWREIRHDGGGQGWVNLNAAGLRKFSDADFPHWRGWSLVDDSADQDSRCDSGLVRGWLDTSGDGTVEPAEATARLADAAVAPKLARAICKFATEWDAATVDPRWGWLKTASRENPQALSDPEFEELRAHITALAFWPGGMGLPAAHWHLPPREFMRHARQCGWLTADELVPLLPGDHPLNFNRMRTRLTAGLNTNTQILPAGMVLALNQVCRKYLLERPLRRAHFWGQIAQETDQLQTVREYASGAAYQGRADLGNTQPGDGVRFRGRGVIQLTGRANYERYGDYRASNFTTDPNPLILQNDAYAASDASTFYWVAEDTRDRINGRWVLDGLVGISRRADNRTFNLLTDAAQIRADVSSVTRQVNRAQLHLDNRIRYFTYAFLHASDSTETLAHGNLRP